MFATSTLPLLGAGSFPFLNLLLLLDGNLSSLPTLSGLLPTGLLDRKEILVSSKLIGSCSWCLWSWPSARMAGRMQSRKRLWGTSL